MRSALPQLAALALGLMLLGSASAATMDEIYNYHRIDESLATAGQVSLEQIPLLADAGVRLVVNLATANPERNAGEGFAVSDAGIAYVNIPVVWTEPTLDDLQLFFDIMDARGDRHTLVHCIANYRASAFTYLYRTLRAGVPEARARTDLEALWTPELRAEYPQWVAFIEAAQAHYSR